ncbi:MAG: hypothetical protein ACI4AA_05905 [Lachnospiraceae bacterium]
MTIIALTDNAVAGGKVDDNYIEKHYADLFGEYKELTDKIGGILKSEK